MAPLRTKICNLKVKTLSKPGSDQISRILNRACVAETCSVTGVFVNKTVCEYSESGGCVFLGLVCHFGNQKERAYFRNRLVCISITLCRLYEVICSI